MPTVQETPPQFDRRGFRIKNAHIGPMPPMRPARPAPGVADQRARFNGGWEDSGVHRDNTPWVPIPHYIAAGKGVASWADYPARNTFWQRDVTYNRRVGTNQTRYLQNPNAPGTGLHTQQSGVHSSATVERYGESADIGKMSRRRQNRLSPARYDGQSFSQTTQIQGARVVTGGQIPRGRR